MKHIMIKLSIILGALSLSAPLFSMDSVERLSDSDSDSDWNTNPVQNINQQTSALRSKRPYSSNSTSEISIAPIKSKPRAKQNQIKNFIDTPPNNSYLKPKYSGASNRKICKLKKLDLCQDESWRNQQLLEGNNCFANGINSPIIKSLKKMPYLKELYLPSDLNAETLIAVLNALQAANLQKLTIQAPQSRSPIPINEEIKEKLKELKKMKLLEASFEVSN